MDISAVCRTCLSTTNLCPIFLYNDKSNMYSSVIYTTTGAKVEMDDGLPQQMCKGCILFINNSLKFRKRCKDVEIYLTNFQNQQPTSLLLKDEVQTCDTKIDVSVNQIKIELESSDSNNDPTVAQTANSEHDKTTIDGMETPKPERNTIKKRRNRKSNHTIKDKIEFKSSDNSNDDPTVAQTTNGEDDKTTIDIMETPKPERNTIKKQRNRKSNHTVKDTELSYSAVCDDNNKQQRVTCKLCSKNLTRRGLDYHMAKSHPGADERKVKCDLCDSFVIKNKLKSHKVMMHGEESLRCTYCKLEVHNKESLVNHLSICRRKRKVAESRRIMVECDVCNITMKKTSLLMHKKIKHAGQGPVCEHCGKRFANKHRLQEHLRAIHGYQKLPCSYCDYRAASALAVKNHERRRHLGEKPFVCEKCGAKFHAAYILVQHRVTHRSDKHYKCDQCSAMFKTNNSLLMHKRSTHSTTAYRCGVCLKTYKCRHYTVKHIKRVHGNNVDLSTFCEPVSKEAENAPSSDE